MGKSGRFSVELSQSDSSQSDQESQQDRFRRVAQELGCDEDEAAFDEQLKVIARQKPKVPEEGQRDT